MSDSDKNPHMDDDFEYSRQVYYNLLVKGEEAMDRMIDVADATEHPRAYEVLSGMMKNMSDINDRLMDLHKKKKDISKVEGKSQRQLEGESKTTNVFLGSTTELQKMLQAEQASIVDVTPDEDS